MCACVCVHWNCATTRAQVGLEVTRLYIHVSPVPVLSAAPTTSDETRSESTEGGLDPYSHRRHTPVGRRVPAGNPRSRNIIIINRIAVPTHVYVPRLAPAPLVPWSIGRGPLHVSRKRYIHLWWPHRANPPRRRRTVSATDGTWALLENRPNSYFGRIVFQTGNVYRKSISPSTFSSTPNFVTISYQNRVRTRNTVDYKNEYVVRAELYSR